MAKYPKIVLTYPQKSSTIDDIPKCHQTFPNILRQFPKYSQYMYEHSHKPSELLDSTPTRSVTNSPGFSGVFWFAHHKPLICSMLEVADNRGVHPDRTWNMWSVLMGFKLCLLLLNLLSLLYHRFLIVFFPKFPSAPKHVRNSQISSDIISSEICCSQILVKHPRSHAGFRGQKHQFRYHLLTIGL